MGITGSIIVYVLIWWIIFFSILPVGIQSKKDTFSGTVRANGKITGNFKLNEFDELLLNSQRRLISILSDKLNSIN